MSDILERIVAAKRQEIERRRAETSERQLEARLADARLAALLLAAVGLYAALSEMVARRTFELGLRVALGAQRGDVFGLVVRRGLILAATGLIVGLAGFAIFGGVVADMLYGVLDPRIRYD